MKVQAEGKRTYHKKVNAFRLCANDVLTHEKLVSYHNSYAKEMQKYGLLHGIRSSEAKHTTTTQYYRELKKRSKVLDTEAKLLLEKKSEAQEELRQVKAEIRTDKLKSAATDTATALTSSMGSLFKSGKMKLLNRRNEDLQSRILKLEDEARQRERNRPNRYKNKKRLRTTAPQTI